MKILSIGDFHGKFPAKLKKIAKEVDLILCVGDYQPWRLKKEFFKHCYTSGNNLWDIVGKKRYKESHLNDLNDTEKILKWFSKNGVPIINVPGNYDTPGFLDTFDMPKKWKHDWKWADQDFFGNLLKKYPQIKRTDYKATKIGELVVIGGFGHSSPGRVKSKAYKKSRKKLDRLFKKYSKKNREGKLIFLFHNMPYNCKLDKIRVKNAVKSARGRHFGNKLTRRIIDRYQPVLAIGGHMHENQGKEELGDTLLINNGAAGEGKAAVINFDEEKGRIKSVKFVK